MEDFNIIFYEKDKRFGTPYVITVDRYSPQARKTTASGDNVGLWKLRGMKGWHGTPRSEGLGGKYNLESQGNLFLAHQAMSSRRQLINSPSIYKCGIMLVLKGGGFLQFYLAPEYSSHL